MKKRIAVLASGGGSNLEAILDHFSRPPASDVGEVVLVVSDKASCGALDRARGHGVPAVSCAPADLGKLLEEQGIDIVALAGYLKFIPAHVTARYAGRMINVHPSLLPDFGGAGMYGRRVHQAVLAAGARTSGATVHFVNNEYDRGAIIARDSVPVHANDTPETLGARVLAVEHRLYPRVLEDLAAGRVPQPQPQTQTQTQH